MYPANRRLKKTVSVALVALLIGTTSASSFQAPKADAKISEGYLKVMPGMTMDEVKKLMGGGSKHHSKMSGNVERHVWIASDREHPVFFKEGKVTHRGTSTPDVITPENYAKILILKNGFGVRDILGFPNKSKGNPRTKERTETWEDGEKFIVITYKGDKMITDSSEKEAALPIVKKLEEAEAKKPEKLFPGVYSRNVLERRAAYAKIAETPYDEKITDEVSKIVAGGLRSNDSSIINSCLKAMPVWGGKAGVEALLDWANLPIKAKDLTDPNRDKRRKAIETLANMKADESPALLANLLKDFHEQVWAAKELIQIGPEKAEKAVLGVLNHKMAMGEAKKVLKEFKTSDDKILDQCLSDIKEKRKQTETWLNAVASVVNMPVIEARRNDVLALAEEIVNEQSDYSADAIFIYRTWGGKEHLPMLEKLAKSSKHKNLAKAAQIVAAEIAKRKG